MDFIMKDIFAVWKPKGMTSHDVVNAVRRATGIKKVGHAGTLDPLAEGVLVVGVGRDATKQLGDIVAKEKEYVAEVLLGTTSSTDDEEGEKTKRNVSIQPSKKDVEKVIKSFIGRSMQAPPRYSALKVGGVPAYAYARAGKAVELKERQIMVKEMELVSYVYPFVCFRTVTGPGVYVRALARDMGERLHTGGYLTALTRTRVGAFTGKDACVLSELKKAL
ncbi:MAG: tRNA pseudouridine(55) synthase TruB [Candidatus Ryanbacteria bacterium CG10_big_fil_rev_8_21_14_0_10_43_42]|uniref:tRNA pseudouridine synthase B n=1 Tax=Candidatus Ryanbacteria bacterium CG10_big_fil_rev_8_21_14_0_10_43_42 TaxID=1974864 RepID=A0A2M8KWT8_9BACT|nr:MAG: tRNA pseudouridine(55) synthase TruB [Candidatus Ryanbacteria bacterium CG10_big_fil_rev_8_21_14_0_10_43_42]